MTKKIIPRPTWLIENISELTASEFKNAHIDTILLDLDNTLIAWNKPFENEKMKEWVRTLQQANLQIIVVSNNVSSHVEKCVAPFNVPFVANAKKPTPFGLRQAMKKINAQKETTVIIGDQLFTDVFAGHFCGIRTILAKPLGEKDMIFTKMIRSVEKLCLNWLTRRYQLAWRKKLN